MGKLTLGIIKPGAIHGGHREAIIQQIKAAGFTLLDQEELRLSLEQAESFYDIHRERPFFSELTTYMSSGTVVTLALEKENAVAAFRELIGATDPAEAAEGTIRRRFGSNVGENAIHGSDSDANAEKEVAFFFPPGDIPSDL